MFRQIELVDHILKEMEITGILPDIMIVGSWCLYFYQYHYKDSDLPPLRTTDIDIDVNSLRKAKIRFNIGGILEKYDFRMDFHGDGSTSFIHADLKIEFLVPEIGRPSHEPVKIHGFGITAQPLRWLDLLEKEVIIVDYKGMQVKVPHPARFAVHKLIISQRRSGRNPKIEKDIVQGLQVIRMLVELGWVEKITGIVNILSRKQKKLIKQALQGSNVEELTGLTIAELEKIFQCRISAQTLK
ncbi:MAG: nucleotidyltransferase domain-containing protein [Candidatus Eremiobacteraeota bacterium]|nr:nucleotidyltransferase domain-containing protein [Candidatus Eremiobacteraeota bacterium]